MAQELFVSSKGFADAQIYIISGAGVPGTTTDTDTAGVGSIYSNSSTGTVYVKDTAGTGTDKWTALSSGNITDAASVTYSNAGSPTLTDVKLALDSLLYVNVAISSMAGGSSNEVGSTVANVSLTWVINKTVTSQSLNQGIGAIAVALRAWAITGANLTSNTTYTVTAGDGVTTDTGSTSVSFYHKFYWGLDPDTTVTDPEIIAFSSQFDTGRANTKTFTAAGQYIYFAYPASWGAASFKVNGLPNTAWTLLTRAFVNASGASESFNIYRSNSLQNGSGIEVQVY